MTGADCPALKDSVRQECGFLLHVIEDGLNRIALNAREYRQDLPDRFRQVRKGGDGVFERTQRVRLQ